MRTFVGILKLITKIEGALYAVHWDGESDDSLDLMAELYNDPHYLDYYFNKYCERLKYYKQTNPIDAAIRTQKEADAILQKLLSLSQATPVDGAESLDDLFKPLHKEKAYNHPRYYTDVKAKGDPKTAPWVRLYAIKCDENLYVITGFGIKLVKGMRDDPDLQKELEKLDQATEYLDSIKMIYR